MDGSLSSEIDSLVQSIIDSGAYSFTSPIEVIREALLQLKENGRVREEREAKLRYEVMKGIDSIRKNGYSPRSVEDIANSVLERSPK